MADGRLTCIGYVAWLKVVLLERDVLLDSVISEMNQSLHRQINFIKSICAGRSTFHNFLAWTHAVASNVSCEFCEP